MLEIRIPEREFFNSGTNEFFYTKEVTISLEHSLISLSKWESKYEKPFLEDNDKTNEELLDYIRCMTITKNVDPNVYYALSEENIRDIQQYINANMTATTITENPADKYGPKKQILSSELIYAMMIEHGIPFECERWHINRLIMLIRVCDARMKPEKKMSKEEMLAQRRALNKQRQMKGRKK